MAGYAVAFNNDPNFVPSGSLQTGRTYSRTTTNNGVWYLHIRPRDNAGNWGAVARRRFSIGAAVAFPGRQVVCFTGDGGLAMLMGELATIAKYRLPVKVIVIKNNVLGMINPAREMCARARAPGRLVFGLVSFVGTRSPDARGLPPLHGLDRNAVDRHLHDLLDRQLLEPGAAHLDDELGRHAVDRELDQVVEAQIVELRPDLLDVFLAELGIARQMGSEFVSVDRLAGRTHRGPCLAEVGVGDAVRDPERRGQFREVGLLALVGRLRLLAAQRPELRPGIADRARDIDALHRAVGQAYGRAAAARKQFSF